MIVIMLTCFQESIMGFLIQGRYVLMRVVEATVLRVTLQLFEFVLICLCIDFLVSFVITL